MYVRRCKVIDDCGSRDGFFHRWVNYTGYLLETNLVLSNDDERRYKSIVESTSIDNLAIVSNPMGIKTYVKPMALVEFPDGSVKAIDVEKITFVDPPYYGQKKGRGEF